MTDEFDGENTVRALLVRFPLRIPLHPLLLRDDSRCKHARPHVQQNEPGKPMLQERDGIHSYVCHQCIGRVDHHLTEIVGTANVLVHAIGDESLLVLERVVFLRIWS